MSFQALWRTLLDSTRWRFLALAVSLLLVPMLGLGRGQAAAPAAAEIDPALEKPLNQFIATEKAREASIHFLHFVLDRRETYLEPDGSILKPPMPTHLEGWIDTATGIRRYEYRPQVSQWIDGAAPYISQNCTQINDGKKQYSIEPDTDLNNIPSSPAPQANGQAFTGFPLEDGSQDAMLAMNAAQSVLVQMQNGKAAGFAPDLRAQWATWNGSKVIEITEAFTANPGGPVAQRQVYRLDPAHDFALCSYEIGFPAHDKTDQPRNVFEVDRFAKSAAGFYYPAVYRTSYAASGTDKFNNTSSEEVTTITTYEPLPALPEHITDLPKPKGQEFVGESNDVVQPPAVHVTVLDAKTKKPVANAPLKVRIGDPGPKESTLKTDATGGADIPLPKEEVTYLSVACDQAPYVPQVVWWRKYANPLRLPAQYEMDLETGSLISGRIEDETGQPIAGAKVEVSIFGPRTSVASFSNHYDIFFHAAKSDATGKWHLDRFPDELDGLSLRVTHPDYQPTTDYGSSDYTQVSQQPLSSLRDGTSVIVLKRGSILTGQLIGAEGKPVAGARLVVGKDIWGTNLPEMKSDAGGHFSFKGLAAGDNFLTIEAAGYKPKIIPLTLPLTQAMGAIQLEKGRVLRGHLVDAAGKPCAGFEVTADTWNKLRTLDLRMTTDANGDFTWDGAPDEPVTFSVMRGPKDPLLYDLPLQASDAVQTITMKPALHLTAQVVDGTTGQPIGKFRMTPGLIFSNSAEPAWETQDMKNGEKGAFEWSATRIGPSLVFKIEAEGYETLVSDPYKTTQSDYTATFRLVKAP
jgi:hypothetical protein